MRRNKMGKCNGLMLQPKASVQRGIFILSVQRVVLQVN